jgi:hypothetical protein
MPWGPAVYEKLDAPIRSRASRWVGRQLCKRRAEFLEFHPALLLGRRFQAIDVTIGGVFDFAASPAPCPNRIPSRLQPSCRNVRPREHEQENQDGINRDRHGVSGRIPPLLFRPFGHDAPSPEPLLEPPKVVEGHPGLSASPGPFYV